MQIRATKLRAKAFIAWTVILVCTAAGGCGRQQADVEADLTTPRGAALIFTRALESGDVEAAKSAAYAGGLEVEWVEAMARAMSGMRQLVAAAEAKFGPEAHSLVEGKQTLRLSGALADAEVQLNGERATVIPGGGDGMKLPMKRIDGNWKIDVGLLTRGEDLDSIVKQLRAVGEVAPRLSKDIEAGKFKSVTDVRRAMGRAVRGLPVDPPAAPPPATNQAIPPPPPTTEEPLPL